jgi:glycogen debranching enzyme
MELQPWLHEIEIAVDGPSTVLSARDGQVGRAAGTGWFVDDRRVLAVLAASLGDVETVPVACDTVGEESRFWGVARHLGDSSPDPTVEVHRRRVLDSHTLTEEITVTSRAADPVATTLSVVVAGDGAELSSVKAGLADAPTPLPSHQVGRGVCWSDPRHRTTVTPDPAPEGVRHTRAGSVLTWPVHVPPGGCWRVSLVVEATREAASAFDAGAGSALCDFTGVRLTGDPSLERLVDHNLTDLRHLLLTDPQDPRDVVAAAGSPWYLTLFGRDSLWTARFMLPFSRSLARGTLRTLARRQATHDDPRLAAEEGKILHEVRRSAYTGSALRLPPLYYGTVDATALWVVLLHDAWRWGLPESDVRELLPTMRRALGWMRRTAAESPDGLLRYVDSAGTGLANQGWKDSGDSMRRADGTVAPAPIALLEAQAYAVEAGRGAADLLDALDEDGADTWRAWAADLAGRVRDRFWVGAGKESYLAMALDAEGHRVDGVGSNMGHALGTGLLTPEEEQRVVDRLMRPDMLREFGIATLSADNPAYNPAGYHTGSVWTHDTAIILHGLVRTGHREEASQVTQALLRLSTAVHHRFPELVAGDPVGTRPVPYPASCRPQAWSAASAAVLAGALVGLSVDVPAGTVALDPSPLLPRGWALQGVRLGDEVRTLTAADAG